jgi:RNA polymerase sigma factor (sigma-70 family)
VEEDRERSPAPRSPERPQPSDRQDESTEPGESGDTESLADPVSGGALASIAASSGGAAEDVGSSQDTEASTASLLAAVRQGDPSARERLIARYLPALRSWARGRLPVGARDLADTDDLVQVTLLRALDHVEGFEPRHAGSFMAYLRRILVNQIRDELRRSGRRPPHDGAEGEIAWLGPSPLEEAVGREVLDSYERAMERLRDDQQEAIMLRVEMGFTHAEVAEAMGLTTPNAARMFVVRSLVRLAEEMKRE